MTYNHFLKSLSVFSFFWIALSSTLSLAQSDFQYIAVQNKEGKWGYFNEKYEVVIPFIYDTAQDFQMNLAWARSGTEYLCIRKDNDKVFSAKFDEVFPFCEGYARFKQNNKYGYINRSGKIIIKPTYDFAADFSEGLARVKKGGYFGFVDYNGNVVIDFEFINATDFSNGRAITENRFFIDKTGKILFEQKKFTKVLPFSDGMAAVSITNPDIFGYIDTTGKLIISYQFEQAGKFSEGLAAVKPGGKNYGYINKEGKAITKFDYIFANEFSNGVALVGISSIDEDNNSKIKYGYINHKGKFIFQPKFFNSASSYKHGIAKINYQGKQLFIDKHGKCVFYCQ